MPAHVNVFVAVHRFTRMLQRTFAVLTALCCLALAPAGLHAQDQPAGEENKFEIGGIEVVGTYNSDANALKAVAGLQVGQFIHIPGTEITRAMQNLWKLRLFDDVQIVQDKRIGNIVFLSIHLTERARLSGWSYKGVRQGTHNDLNDVVKPFLIKGQVASTAMQLNATRAIQKFFIEKGYLDVKANVHEEPAPERANSVNLVFDIQLQEKIKIDDIDFTGNEVVTDAKLRKLMKETKRKAHLLKSSKFNEDNFQTDQQAILDHYRTLGYRDARITSDSMWREEAGDLHIALHIDEGPRYYFGKITWKGNAIQSSETLSRVLGIHAGDVFNEELLHTRLTFSLDGRDVSSLYMDDGYLFFNVEPTEVAVRGDTIDLEMRVFEGPQATIDEVIIKGNTRTHEHVIRRELRTQPGQKFSRSDIIRSQRQIIALGYFNPETLDIQTPIDQTNGTVDIVYQLEERPSDQLELSAGWGGTGRSRVIGTLGVTFNNFSLRNIFNSESWSPLPQGDGQRLSIRAQTNGEFFQSYNFSFTEPWLGGKKPNSFTVGGVLTKFNEEYFGRGKLTISRAFIGLGTRLKWPDDNFVSNTTLSFENLSLDNYFTADFRASDGTIISNGLFHNFHLQQSLTRTTINDPTFPRSGSTITLSLQLTPPYTLLGRSVDLNNQDGGQDGLPRLLQPGYRRSAVRTVRGWG